MFAFSISAKVDLFKAVAKTGSVNIFICEVVAVAATLRFFFCFHIHFLFNRSTISCVYRPPGRKMTTRPSVGSSQRSELWYALSSIWSSSGWIRPLSSRSRRRRFRVLQSLLTSRFHWALLPEANPCEAYFFRERVILVYFLLMKPHLIPFGTSPPLRPGWLCQISSLYL